jgi:molybdate transport system regulatory protein
MSVGTAMKASEKKHLLRLRVILQPGMLLGPGRADLLEGIKLTGSIAAAGRRMGMSYKRAWTLIETLNTEFPAPLVTGAKGGARGGGSSLTELGEVVLARYRSMQARTEAAIRADVRALDRRIRDIVIKK